jgi:hypothetical protein
MTAGITPVPAAAYVNYWLQKSQDSSLNPILFSIARIVLEFSLLKLSQYNYYTLFSLCFKNLLYTQGRLFIDSEPSTLPTLDSAGCLCKDKTALKNRCEVIDVCVPLSKPVSRIYI